MGTCSLLRGLPLRKPWVRTQKTGLRYVWHLYPHHVVDQIKTKKSFMRYRAAIKQSEPQNEQWIRLKLLQPIRVTLPKIGIPWRPVLRKIKKLHARHCHRQCPWSWAKLTIFTHYNSQSERWDLKSRRCGIIWQEDLDTKRRGQ